MTESYDAVVIGSGRACPSLGRARGAAGRQGAAVMSRFYFNQREEQAMNAVKLRGSIAAVSRPIHPYPVEACAEDVSVGLCGVERVRRGVEPAMRGGSGHSGVCLASMSTLKDRW